MMHDFAQQDVASIDQSMVPSTLGRQVDGQITSPLGGLGPWTRPSKWAWSLHVDWFLESHAQKIRHAHSITNGQ